MADVRSKPFQTLMCGLQLIYFWPAFFSSLGQLCLILRSIPKDLLTVKFLGCLGEVCLKLCATARFRLSDAASVVRVAARERRILPRGTIVANGVY